ncbi:ribonuclease D [Aidingimonas halophila]|uniref:Ribonuclease D n=1 Tax=Aidingimonas halophila TaxID=574349 RepID=A0A1H3EUJ1_9GAMM|nr:ribonuclease D [Aidingimonas halophila]GHC31634.1 ribonuclease D [Aidingimonas halophila]SDX81599.1 ribonuclease D [Aidingimonas halophila]
MPLTPDIHWIDTPEALDAACRDLESADTLALDTEFFRESTFHPVPALVQLTAGGCVYLIDPQAVAATAACRTLLASGPVKLLHASSEDIEVLAAWAGVIVAPLVDTQLAQGLLGEDPAMGYQRLVAHWAGENLPKDETRSNWLERPLSEAQREYAALDVVYLLEVWYAQRERLEALDRFSWLEDDCQALVRQAGRDESDDALWYLRQRQLWRLSPRQMEAYRLMTSWRESEVRRRDLPRGWLVSDKLLFAIAEKMPRNRYELAAIDGIKPSLVKREGDTLLALLNEARQLTDASLPEALPSPLTSDFKKRLKRLKAVVNRDAEQLGVAPEVLMRRRDLEALVTANLRNDPLPLPQGWRGERLSSALRQVLVDEELA